MTYYLASKAPRIVTARRGPTGAPPDTSRRVVKRCIASSWTCQARDRRGQGVDDPTADCLLHVAFAPESPMR